MRRPRSEVSNSSRGTTPAAHLRVPRNRGGNTFVTVVLIAAHDRTLYRLIAWLDTAGIRRAGPSLCFIIQGMIYSCLMNFMCAKIQRVIGKRFRQSS